MNTQLNRLPYEVPTLSVAELTSSLNDVTQKLYLANKELLSIHQEQSALLTNLSHDLRSPLTAIHSAVEYLLSFDSINHNDIIGSLKLIQLKLKIVENLIDDIFLLSQIESKSWSFNFQPINIGIFLEEFFFSCQSDLKYSKRNLVLEVSPHFPYESLVDPTLLYRLLDNLMTNSLKYSPDQTTIILGARQASNASILIYIQDFGYGIAPEYLTKVFERSFTISTARTPGPNSSNGLGLSIAKSIAAQHNGEIWCESQLGIGSTFYFTLPIYIN